MKKNRFDKALEHIQHVHKQNPIDYKVIMEAEDFDFVRVRALSNLCESYIPRYQTMHKLSERSRQLFIDEMSQVFFPNILRDLPGLLKYIHTLQELNDKLKDESLEWKTKARKAYRNVGWKNSDFRDNAPIDIQKTLDDLHGPEK